MNYYLFLMIWLSYVMDVVKKTEYNKLFAKVNNIDIIRFVLKATYDTDKPDLEKKLSDADKKFLIQVI